MQHSYASVMVPFISINSIQTTKCKIIQSFFPFCVVLFSDNSLIVRRFMFYWTLWLTLTALLCSHCVRYTECTPVISRHIRLIKWKCKTKAKREMSSKYQYQFKQMIWFELIHTILICECVNVHLKVDAHDFTSSISHASLNGHVF